MANKERSLIGSAQVPAAKFRYPGIEVDLMLLMKLEGDERTDTSRLNDKEKRQFDILYLLCKSFEFPNNIEFNIDNSLGDSYISFPEGVKYADVKSSDYTLRLIPKKNRELSAVEFSCIAHSPEDALEMCYEAVMPVIDHLSYLYNIPIIVREILVTDKKNDSVYRRVYVPYLNVRMSEYQQVLPNEMKPVFSLFREAKNSGSYYYKFLCYFKILEGLYKHVRPMIFREAKRRNKSINTVKEVVPKHKGIGKDHDKFIGTPIGDLYDGYLRQEYRNAIAHFSVDGSAPAVMSSFDMLTRITSATTLLEICCIEMIKNTIDYLSQI